MRSNTSSTIQPQSLPPAAAFVAIDWADQHHVVALQAAGAKHCELSKLEQKPDALIDWVAHLRQRFGGRPVALILEQKRGALMHALVGQEFFWLYPVNPRMLAQLRSAFRLSGAKDDPGDARLLLEVLLKHHERLVRWQPQDEQTRLLSLLCEDRRGAVNERTRLIEKLLATLKGYYPQFIALVAGEVGTALACRLLLKYPDFESLRRARPESLRRFFYAHHFRRPDQLEKRLAELPASEPLTRDRAIIRAGALKARRLVAQILQVLNSLGAYDQEIAQQFKAHPDAAIFESLPGAGAALAPRLLCALGNDRSRWSSAAALASFCGVAPVVERSGKSFQVHWRWACPKFLRQSFHEFAGASLRFCPWAKLYYQTQLQRGKKHHAAVRALAFKWTRILYRCWKARVPYQNDLYPPALLAPAH
jgi:transposase